MSQSAWIKKQIQQTMRKRFTVGVIIHVRRDPLTAYCGQSLKRPENRSHCHVGVPEFATCEACISLAPKKRKR